MTYTQARLGQKTRTIFRRGIVWDTENIVEVSVWHWGSPVVVVVVVEVEEAVRSSESTKTKALAGTVANKAVCNAKSRASCTTFLPLPGMQFLETILCGTAPQTAGSGPGVIAIHDIQTGSPLANFKQTNAGIHSTAFVETRDGQGGFLLAAQLDKSILNVYNFQKVVISLSAIFTKS
jgi:hypothetical protein